MIISSNGIALTGYENISSWQWRKYILPAVARRRRTYGLVVVWYSS